MTRIGVFGGTFSPPHLGHRDLALLAAKQLQLDMIYIMPCQFPPHKESCISTFHRLNMLRLLFAEYNIFRFDFSEILRKGPSLTHLSLENWQKSHPNDEIFFIMGSDSFATITTWDHWQGMILNSNIIVIPRSEKPNSIKIPSAWACHKEKVHILNESVQPISSTLIRETKNLSKLKDYLGNKVASYYLEHFVN